MNVDYGCGECLIWFYTLHDMEVHTLREHDLLICGHCLDVFGEDDDYAGHLEQHDNNQRR